MKNSIVMIILLILAVAEETKAGLFDNIAGDALNQITDSSASRKGSTDSNAKKPLKRKSFFCNGREKVTVEAKISKLDPNVKELTRNTREEVGYDLYFNSNSYKKVELVRITRGVSGGLKVGDKIKFNGQCDESYRRVEFLSWHKSFVAKRKSRSHKNKMAKKPSSRSYGKNENKVINKCVAAADEYKTASDEVLNIQSEMQVARTKRRIKELSKRMDDANYQLEGSNIKYEKLNCKKYEAEVGKRAKRKLASNK